MCFRLPRVRIFLCCLIIVELTACLARRRLITRNGHATVQALAVTDQKTLLARISDQYQRLQNFSATVDMVPALGSAEKSRITEYKDVRGYIFFRKPTDIRIIGLYPVVRSKAFDMLSIGPEFRLHIPARNRYIVGRNDLSINSPNKIENLRPQHFLDALLVRPLNPAVEKSVLENFTDEDNAVYILHFLQQAPDGQWHMDRQVWFDRVNLALVRQLVFDPSGNILTDARYTKWQPYDGVPFPKHIEIDRPKDEYAVVLDIVKMDIDKGVTPDKFVLEQPEGTTLQALGQKPAATPAAPPPQTSTRKGKKK